MKYSNLSRMYTRYIFTLRAFCWPSSFWGCWNWVSKAGILWVGQHLPTHVQRGEEYPQHRLLSAELCRRRGDPPGRPWETWDESLMREKKLKEWNKGPYQSISWDKPPINYVDGKIAAPVGGLSHNFEAFNHPRCCRIPFFHCMGCIDVPKSKPTNR